MSKLYRKSRRETKTELSIPQKNATPRFMEATTLSPGRTNNVCVRNNFKSSTRTSDFQHWVS